MTTAVATGLSILEARRIADYVAEETRRQGDGPLDVGYMLNAWYDAIEQKDAGKPLSLDLIIGWAKKIDPAANQGLARFRTGPVWIGPDKRTADGIERRMELWIESVLGGAFDEKLDFAADFAYKAFEEIHPFFDANGRTGKVIFAWLNDTLRDPNWPINWWGISNP